MQVIYCTPYHINVEETIYYCSHWNPFQPTTLPATNLRPSFTISDYQTGNGTMHFLKSCTVANDLSRKKHLWKLLRSTSQQLYQGAAWLPLWVAFWPPNEERKAKWVIRAYQIHCQSNISQPRSFCLSRHTYAHRLYIGCVHIHHSWVSAVSFSPLTWHFLSSKTCRVRWMTELQDNSMPIFDWSFLHVTP